MWLSHYKLNEHEQKLVDMSAKEFDEYMMSNYADMFKNRYEEEGQQVILPMNFGFEIGPGWRHVIDSLCRKLKLIKDLTGCVCIFDQIKEKYGGARFYHHVEGDDGGNRDAKIAKTVCDIVENLVNSHEEYCDYVCDELGTNLHSGEKIVIGGWYYGCGIEGFKKVAPERWSSCADDRIKMAEMYLERKEKERKMKTDCHNLNDEELDLVCQLVQTYIDKGGR